MDFIKKHWEKVLLGVVLVGLAVAVAFLPLKIASERAMLEETRKTVLNPQIEPLPEIDLSAAEAALARAKAPVKLDFTTGHRIFNPVLWQKMADGRPLKVQSGKEIGPSAVVVVKTEPLYLIVSFDNVITNETGARYAIGVERQAASRTTDRRKRQTYASEGTKTDHFTLNKVKGPPENPEALILDVTGTEEPVSLVRAKPFKRVDGYLADLRYPPENRTWLKKRVGDRLTFGGDDYNIVAINENEVVFSAPSGKKTTVRMTAAP